MRRIVGGLALLLLATGTGLAGAQKSGSTDEFKELIQRYWQAWSTLNPDNVAPLYAKDADAVFFDVAPLKYDGWEAYKAGFLKVFATAASATVAANDDLKATRRGDIAWTSSTFHGTVVQKDGKTMQLLGRHTAIWEKRGGHWVIVHEHVSEPLAE